VSESVIFTHSYILFLVWAFAVVCFVLLAISIIVEHVIDAIGKVITYGRKVYVAQSKETFHKSC